MWDAYPCTLEAPRYDLRLWNGDVLAGYEPTSAGNFVRGGNYISGALVHHIRFSITYIPAFMKLTKTDLIRAVAGCTEAEAEAYLRPINDTLVRYKINTPLRVAHFLAQIGHESNGFNAVREYASGAAYEGRASLGNTQPGDGVRFKGRGLIQITGRANYFALSKAFQTDFISHPVLLEQPEYAALSAGWYWNSRSLNELADGNFFVAITKRINGGTNGIADREARFLRAAKVLGIPGGRVPAPATKVTA